MIVENSLDILNPSKIETFADVVIWIALLNLFLDIFFGLLIRAVLLIRKLL